MSEKYIPLYRKYRPKNLQEVVGQEHIKKALTNAINLNKLSHAYLFTGPRGTGKTSIARILAKSLNCKEGPTVTPCEQCASCIDIKNSTPIDVIEIDAASNRSVEDARNILEKIQYIPVNGKYKIYIIDEVHMLTKEAFNTLLKTLEEPPENVVFILATTEPHKVLETIISRCQRFDFRRITTNDIVGHLKNIAKLEKIKIDEDALFTIAKNAAGGMRDSLALLDQLAVLDASKTITSDDINQLLGRISFDILNNLSENIISSKPQEAIEVLEKIYNSGNEPSQILINLMGYLKNLLIVKNCENKELLLELTQLNDSQINALKSQSQNIETHQITFLIEKIVYYIKELKITTNQHLWLEVAIIDLANLTQNTSLLELQARISKIENSNFVPQTIPQISAAQPVQKPQMPAKEQIVETKIEKKIENTPIENTSIEQSQEVQEESLMPISHLKQESLDNLSELWLKLLQNISSTPTVSLLTQHTMPIEISEEKIIIGCKENFLKMLNTESKKRSIEEGAKQLFDKEVNVIIKSADLSDFQVVEKKNQIINKQPEKIIEKQEIEFTQVVEADEEEEYVEHQLAKTANKTEKYLQSDQVSIVMSLFDGKYID